MSRTSFNHVRSADPRVRELIAAGYARSATFRHLLDSVESSPCIVYVATAVKLSGGMRGALLHVSAGGRDLPILRVLLKTNLSEDESIGTIGHELQHVLEVMSTSATGRIDYSTTFGRLDPMAARATGSHRYETQEAILVTRKVRDELRTSAR